MNQFKESIDTPQTGATTASAPEVTKDSPPGTNSAPTAPKFEAVMDKPEVKEEKSAPAPAAAVSPEAEILVHQVEYLKKEVDRLESFLEQSEMVNNRLRQLLAENNIDVSEIAKAIEEVSKTAISSTAIKKEPEKEAEKAIPEPVKKEPTPEPVKVEPKKEEPVKKLDPAVEKIFNEFRAKLDKGMSDEDIKMEILEFRETLMDFIPHSRVFYEMQVEYRKWKKGTSSVDALKKAMKEWEKTIASI